LKQFPYVVFVPDGDDGGNHLIDSLAPHIEDIKIYIAKIPWGKDPAICTEEEIESAIGSASLWKPSEEKMIVEVDY
jgi:DNA primase